MTDVPRETSDPPGVGATDVAGEPASAAAVFGAGLASAREFARLLATDGVTRGLLGPRELPRLWGRHLLNCAVLGELVPQGATVVDIGSGAGLPGLALAIARPDLDVEVVDPLLRRVTFLDEAVRRLQLSNVRVTRARAEDLLGRPTVDVATARAVAALPQLAAWCLPLVGPGGSLLALKGDRATIELHAAAGALAGLGAVDASVQTCGRGLVDPPATVIRIVRGPAPAGSPGSDPLRRATRGQQ